jgi:hypothetical protein
VRRIAVHCVPRWWAQCGSRRSINTDAVGAASNLCSVERTGGCVLAHVGANAAVLLHFAFIVFVIFGACLVLKWRWVAWLHVPAATWGALVEFFGLICPLTPIEQRLRDAAGMTTYEGDFVGHYLLPVMYPAGLTPAIRSWLGATLVALNIAIYALVIARSHRALPR